MDPLTKMLNQLSNRKSNIEDQLKQHTDLEFVPRIINNFSQGAFQQAGVVNKKMQVIRWILLPGPRHTRALREEAVLRNDDAQGGSPQSKDDGGYHEHMTDDHEEEVCEEQNDSQGGGSQDISYHSPRTSNSSSPTTSWKGRLSTQPTPDDHEEEKLDKYAEATEQKEELSLVSGDDNKDTSADGKENHQQQDFSAALKELTSLVKDCLNELKEVSSLLRIAVDKNTSVLSGRKGKDGGDTAVYEPSSPCSPSHTKSHDTPSKKKRKGCTEPVFISSSHQAAGDGQPTSDCSSSNTNDPKGDTSTPKEPAKTLKISAKRAKELKEKAKMVSEKIDASKTNLGPNPGLGDGASSASQSKPDMSPALAYQTSGDSPSRKKQRVKAYTKKQPGKYFDSQTPRSFELHLPDMTPEDLDVAKVVPYFEKVELVKDASGPDANLFVNIPFLLSEMPRIEKHLTRLVTGQLSADALKEYHERFMDGNMPGPAHGFGYAYVSYIAREFLDEFIRRRYFYDKPNPSYPVTGLKIAALWELKGSESLQDQLLVPDPQEERLRQEQYRRVLVREATIILVSDKFHQTYYTSLLACESTLNRGLMASMYKAEELLAKRRATNKFYPSA